MIWEPLPCHLKMADDINFLRVIINCSSKRYVNELGVYEQLFSGHFRLYGIVVRIMLYAEGVKGPSSQMETLSENAGKVSKVSHFYGGLLIHAIFAYHTSQSFSLQI